MDINTAGERSYIYAESPPLAECGGYSRNLADKNQGEDDNYPVDNAVAYFQAEKSLRFLFPRASLDLIVFLIEIHGVPPFRKATINYLGARFVLLSIFSLVYDGSMLFK